MILQCSRIPTCALTSTECVSCIVTIHAVHFPKRQEKDHERLEEAIGTMILSLCIGIHAACSLPNTKYSCSNQIFDRRVTLMMIEVQFHGLFARDHTHLSSSVGSVNAKDGIRMLSDRVRNGWWENVQCHVFTYWENVETDFRLNWQPVPSQPVSSPFDCLDPRNCGK